MTTVTAPTVGGLVGWAAATDHKRLAARAGVLSGVFFAAGGIVALIMRSELARPGLQVVSRQHYNELFSLHGSTMLYLVMTPAALALGMYLIPLQIGAADLLAPRLNLFAVWLIFGGGLLSYMGLLTAHGPADVGWTAFPPLSDRTFSPGPGVDFWIAGTALAALAAIILSATMLGTILLRRAPGMTMLRLPVFCWAMVATCLLTVFSFPALLAALGLLFADRHLSFGLDPVTYLHLFWFFGHPVVYVLFFPFVGAVAEVVAVCSGRRFAGYVPLVISLLGFSAVSMAVWAHHMFTTGQVDNRYFGVTSTALLIFAGIEYLDLVATMWGGALVFRTSMLFALAFMIQFLVGGLTGIIVASPVLDYHLNDSYFVIAHFHYTLFAGSLFGLFAGIYHWYPKWTGHRLGEGLGKLHFWLLLIGTNLTFFPMFVLGYDGMTRRVADYPSDAGFTGLNELATLGSAVIAAAMIVFVVNLIRSWGRAEPAESDPWEGHTLEWWTTSPPPRHNFDSLPAIRSYAPLLDLREDRGSER
jgi:cytochrome c oxidase subunit 1